MEIEEKLVKVLKDNFTEDEISKIEDFIAASQVYNSFDALSPYGKVLFKRAFDNRYLALEEEDSDDNEEENEDEYY